MATGTNQEVSISYYSQYVSGPAVVASFSQATDTNKYLPPLEPSLERLYRDAIRAQEDWLRSLQGRQAWLAKFVLSGRS